MDTIAGLPLHPLIVHVVVVAVPVAALVAIAISLWPAVRTRLGWFPPVLALIALIAVPIATSAGEALFDRLHHPASAVRHAELGDSLILAVGPLFAVVALQWVLDRDSVQRRLALGATSTVWVQRGIAAAVIIAAVASIWLVVLIGDTGARSVWT